MKSATTLSESGTVHPKCPLLMQAGVPTFTPYEAIAYGVALLAAVSANSCGETVDSTTQKMRLPMLDWMVWNATRHLQRNSSNPNDMVPRRQMRSLTPRLVGTLTAAFSFQSAVGCPRAKTGVFAPQHVRGACVHLVLEALIVVVAALMRKCGPKYCGIQKTMGIIILEMAILTPQLPALT